MLSYNKAKELYESARNKDAGKPYGNNTRIVKTEQGYGVKYHATVVVNVLTDRWVLNTGGWQTVTTKQRINENAPVYINQEKHIWYIDGITPYQDGIEVDRDGRILSEIDYSEVERQEQVLRKIKKYVRDFANHGVSDPSGGDCWICLGLIQNNGNPTCLQSHIDDSYYHGSLLVNALNHSGYISKIGLDKTAIRQVLFKYLKFHLLTNKEKRA